MPASSRSAAIVRSSGVQFFRMRPNLLPENGQGDPRRASGARSRLADTADHLIGNVEAVGFVETAEIVDRNQQEAAGGCGSAIAFVEGRSSFSVRCAAVHLAGERIEARELGELLFALVALVDDADDAVGALRRAVVVGEPAAGILDPDLGGSRRSAQRIFHLIGDAGAVVALARASSPRRSGRSGRDRPAGLGAAAGDLRGDRRLQHVATLHPRSSSVRCPREAPRRPSARIAADRRRRLRRSPAPVGERCRAPAVRFDRATIASRQLAAACEEASAPGRHVRASLTHLTNFFGIAPVPEGAALRRPPATRRNPQRYGDAPGTSCTIPASAPASGVGGTCGEASFYRK